MMMRNLQKQKHAICEAACDHVNTTLVRPFSIWNRNLPNDGEHISSLDGGEASHSTLRGQPMESWNLTTQSNKLQ